MLLLGGGGGGAWRMREGMAFREGQRRHHRRRRRPRRPLVDLVCSQFGDGHAHTISPT